MGIKDIINGELVRNAKKIGMIDDELFNLPEGSLVKVRNNDSVYIYLKKREGSTVKSTYIGKEGSVEATRIEIDISRKKTLLSRKRKLENERRLMIKMLKVK